MCCPEAVLKLGFALTPFGSYTNARPYRHDGCSHDRKSRHRPRRRDALAPSSRHGALSCTDNGQADHHGRRTHESLGRVLDGRYNIVLSRQRHLQAPGFQATDCVVAHSFNDALIQAEEYAASNNAWEIAIIGGASVYKQGLAIASRLYLTQVHATIEGDARFPTIERDDWREVSREKRVADTRNCYDMSFVKLVRRPAN